MNYFLVIRYAFVIFKLIVLSGAMKAVCTFRACAECILAGNVFSQTIPMTCAHCSFQCDKLFILVDDVY